MFFAPAWSKKFKNIELILNTKQIKELEILRKKYNIPHDAYSFAVESSSELGKIIIRRDYKKFNEQYPDLSEKQILTALLQYENHFMELSGSTELMTEEQITNAMSRINSLDDLCDFVVELEHRENPMFYDHEITDQIESIVRNG